MSAGSNASSQAYGINMQHAGSMYQLMYRDLHKHVDTLWHSLVLIAGSYAIFNLEDKPTQVSPWLSSILIMSLAFWCWLNLLNAAFIAARCRSVIQYIDLQFGTASPQTNRINGAFADNGDRSTLFTWHFRIQGALPTSIAILAAIRGVWDPGDFFGMDHSAGCCLPRIMIIAWIVLGAWLLNGFRIHRKNRLEAFLEILFGP